ncbi:Membrane-bound mannosyltransferase [Halorhabdus sp. SVX81]|nr:Membrane-bound mannosyltransferase [Halorhabdus sp. SVX81]
MAPFVNRVIDRLGLKEPRRALALVVLAALVARLIALDVRVAHWDEARVGYWILHTADTGWWEYRPIIHGPFVQHVTRWTFAVAGVSDFTMRLPVALIGSALPATALLFRSRLRDVETIALGVILAANPLLLYYSRFMRSDLPLAAFAFVTLGAIVAAIDTDRRRYLHLAAIAFALALTTKENAVLYPVSWLGAGTLVVLSRLAADHYDGGDPIATLRSWVTATRRRAWAWRRTLLALPFEILAVVAFFYAPRSPEADAGLFSALADPTLLPGVLGQATVGATGELMDLWLSPSVRGHAYAPYLAHFLVVLAMASAGTAVLAVLAVRWQPRPLVTFCGWWALSGVVGYPYVADIKAPWLAIHVVVALAIPAAVGLLAVVERFRAARIERRQLASVGLALLLVFSGVFAVASAGFTTYHQPPDGFNVVAQSGQPGGDIRPVLQDIRAVAGHNDGTDVLYYGNLSFRDETWANHPPAPSDWFNRLPIPWYTERANATVDSVETAEGLPTNPPPVVIAEGRDRAELAAALDGYAVREEAILIRGGRRTIEVFGFEYHLGGKTFAFFIDRDALEAATAGRDSAPS